MGGGVTEDQPASDVANRRPGLLSLPMAHVFIVLTMILAVVLGFWVQFRGLAGLGEVIGFLTVMPPFLSLIWLGSGMLMMVQWMRILRDEADREP